MHTLSRECVMWSRDKNEGALASPAPEDDTMRQYWLRAPRAASTTSSEVARARASEQSIGNLRTGILNGKTDGPGAGAL